MAVKLDALTQIDTVAFNKPKCMLAAHFILLGTIKTPIFELAKSRY